MYDVCNRKSDKAAPCFHSSRSLLFIAQYLLWNKSWVFPRLLKASCEHSPKLFKRSKCPGFFLDHFQVFVKPSCPCFPKAIPSHWPSLPNPPTSPNCLKEIGENKRSLYIPPWLARCDELKGCIFLCNDVATGSRSLMLSKCYDVVFLTICRTSNFL